MDENRSASSDRSDEEPSLSDRDDLVAEEADGRLGEPDSEKLQQFWTLASRYAHVGDFDAFMGVPWGEAVSPQAWSFGSDPETADELLDLVLTGEKRATTGLHQEYVDEDEPLPQIGDLSILLDGASEPKALIRTEEVQIVPFSEVTEEQAAAEGEGDRTLDSWRQAHREFWSDQGAGFGDDSLVVWERFKVLYSL